MILFFKRAPVIPKLLQFEGCNYLRTAHCGIFFRTMVFLLYGSLIHINRVLFMPGLWWDARARSINFHLHVSVSKYWVAHSPCSLALPHTGEGQPSYIISFVSLNKWYKYEDPGTPFLDLELWWSRLEFCFYPHRQFFLLAQVSFPKLTQP